LEELTGGEVGFLALELIRSSVTAYLFEFKKHAGTLGGGFQV
jgi:hypothetical protein